MPSPFPGMNPYLEHPTPGPGVHNGLIAALQLSLAPQLRPRYYVALEERLYITEPDLRVLVGRPDLAVVGQPAAETGLKPSPSASSMLTVQVPLPDEVRETYLEVRETGTDYVRTVLIPPTNKRPRRGRRSSIKTNAWRYWRARPTWWRSTSSGPENPCRSWATAAPAITACW